MRETNPTPARVVCRGRRGGRRRPAARSGPFLRDAVAARRTVSRRPDARGDRRAGRAGPLLLRRRRRRRLGEPQRGTHVGADLRRASRSRRSARSPSRRPIPDVLYVGTGEADMRSDISYGNGMYRSADGGQDVDARRPRRHAADRADRRRPARSEPRLRRRARPRLRSERRARRLPLARRRPHVAARASSATRTPARSTSPSIPANPRTILAALWQTRRPPWNVYPPSNGPGSGLYRSEDGGDTWTPVAGGLSLREARPHRRRVRAERCRSASTRSSTRRRAASTRRETAARRGTARAATAASGSAAGTSAASPSIRRTRTSVYVCDTAMYRSTDGGKTFLPIKGAPGGDDYHQLLDRSRRTRAG